MNDRGVRVVISQRPKRNQPIEIDGEAYKGRHLIENFLCKSKEVKGITMRSDKSDLTFSAMIYACAAVTNSR